MDHFVTFKALFVLISISTFLANIWLFSIVGDYMSVEIVFPAGNKGTRRAGERFTSSRLGTVEHVNLLTGFIVRFVVAIITIARPWLTIFVVFLNVSLHGVISSSVATGTALVLVRCLFHPNWSVFYCCCLVKFRGLNCQHTLFESAKFCHL